MKPRAANFLLNDVHLALGGALVKAGQSFDQIRDAHYDLDDEVNQQFLSPVKELLEKDGKVCRSRQWHVFD